MQQYKEKLRHQNLLYALCALSLVTIFLLSLAGEAGLVPFFVPKGDSHWQSLWRGYIAGASCSLTAFFVVGLIQNFRALRSDQALKKLYVREHDERSIQIWAEARAAALRLFLLLGLVATVITGYFSMVVGITLLLCVLAASLLTLAFQLYFRKKL